MIIHSIASVRKMDLFYLFGCYLFMGMPDP